ncbi:MAG: allulose-6-phosphate 3-epimerase [Firmicutes bacterium]|nr:allulose-6-phosphate 3-epimerase [Bacillota bacterium]
MKISVSVMCMDYKDMGRQFELLNDFTDAYHWDVMDGNYVPNLSLNLDMLKTLSPVIHKPIHAHLMVTRPQDYVEHLIELGVSEISLHIDTVSRQMFRLMNLAEEAGVAVGAVLNPMETIDSLQYVLGRLASVTVMTVDPGFAGQKFIPEMLDKIAALKELKLKQGYKYEIEVDGSVNPRTFERLMDAGAERFVLGSSGLFTLGATLEEAIAVARSFIPFKNSSKV